MQFPKLTPLQSRIVVSLAASLIVIVFYLSLSSPHFAYAVETDSIAPKDPNRPPLLGLQDRLGFTERYSWDDDEVEQNYEPEFAELERGISEWAPKSQNLNNNTPGKRSIQVGDGPHYWVFQNETLWGTQAPRTKRLPSPLVDITHWGTFQNSTEQQNSPEGTRGVYVSLSVCDQPSSTSGTPNDAPPQLELYISFSNPEPGPGNSTYSVPVDAGFGSSTLNARAAIYFAVLAPPSSNFNGKYSYELAVSIDAPYASYVDTTFLNVLDSDTNATLLETNVTANVTGPLNNTEYQQWMDGTPPFSLFALKNDSAIWGIHKSFCGLKNHAQIKGDPTDQQPSSVNMSMTDRAGGRPKEQFYIQNLNGSSAYLAIPAIDGTSNQSGGGAVGGGGLLWAPTSFRTKSDYNCRVIFNLPFCSEVAYAVPSNQHKAFADLVKWYDGEAQPLYVNFSNSLQQIPCNATSSAQYSLARNCTDCASAYRNWLCAVLIPRCEDFSSPSKLFKPRNIDKSFINGTKPSADLNPIFTHGNNSISYLTSMSSRYLPIDAFASPGPYKEVLPCADMCYELVRSCPASLGFACPLLGKGLELSYGKPDPSNKTNVTCNWLGDPDKMSLGVRRGQSLVLLTIACATALFVGYLA
ncbi:MAG: calcium channel MID1 [Lasallia pustulata]|uniref:Calcium channel MID1 n=1 Tax=Lasallia pustulata TaxID=136370 RepID=A0A5M8PTI9_9LECA|nr:MAG: calcium channel MID1 [Lasallia pustulata]